MTNLRERLPTPVMNRLEQEPIWRKIEERIDDPLRGARNMPGSALRDGIPQFPNRNFGGGIAVGLIEAGIAVILEETVGIPFGADADVVATEATEEGAIYTVNVDAPTENMAQARAFLDSGTGFTTVLTDTLNVRNVEVLKTRPLRDTYQVEVLVQD